MKRILRILLFVILGFISLIITLLIVGYFLNSGNYNPRATVVNDKSLPQIKLNKINFHYETFGNDTNDVIIVLHGGPGPDYKNLLPLKELSDKFFVVFYDQRGSGLTERLPEEKLKFKYYIEDLNAFVEHFSKNKKAILIGHCWGGILATAYTELYPNKVKKLLLAEPDGLSNEMLKELSKNDSDAKLELSFYTISHTISCWLESLHVNGPDEYASKDYFINAFIMGYERTNHPFAKYYCNKTIPKGFIDIWRFGYLASMITPQSVMDSNGRYKDFLRTEMKNYQQEVLFIVGECNKIIGEEFQKKQMKLFNKASIVVIPNCGHMMISEAPKETIKAIREFLEK